MSKEIHQTLQNKCRINEKVTINLRYLVWFEGVEL